MTQAELTQQFQSLFQEGRTPDLSAAMSLLSEIQKDYTERDTLSTSTATLRDQITTQQSQIDSLKQSNYNLFMTYGYRSSSPSSNSDPTNPNPSLVPPANSSPNPNPGPSLEDPIFGSILELDPGQDKIEEVIKLLHPVNTDNPNSILKGV